VLFLDNQNISELIVYDKRAKARDKKGLFVRLKDEHFDLIVDLRDTLYGRLLSAKYRSKLCPAPKNLQHMKDRHLWKIQDLKSQIQNKSKIQDAGFTNKTLYISQQDQGYIHKILSENNIKENDSLIIVAAGARSHPKRWPKDRFAQLSNKLIQEKNKIVLVGDNDDVQLAEYIREACGAQPLNLCGRTSIAQLAALISRSTLVITNDSAILHLASYLNAPIAAIFGPTNDLKYGPWSQRCAVVKKEIFCRPCEKAQCRFKTLDCLRLIKVEDVLSQVNSVLNSKSEILNSKQTLNPKLKVPNLKRILIVRTDRVGDVLLSTPVISALRLAYPQAYIAMMTSPYAKEIVEANPYLDEVIIYDKDGKHKSWSRSMKFSLNLKKKKFDLALVLHPTNRVHLVTYFAGIPRRVGYDRKMGFLLTDRIRHSKQSGQKHETEYNLDLVRYLGITPQGAGLFMALKPESQDWVDDLFLREGIKETDKLLAIHPGASCPSKVWPNERFAEAADRLVEKYGFKVLVVAGPKDMAIAGSLIKNMRQPALNLAGMTSIAQLASVLKRCHLFISNDSGPVHVACSVGTPVISIFARSQAGLSPRRWGPLGKNDKILHKTVGCIECLAHDCIREFACIKSITVNDIMEAVEEMKKEGVDI
jgi:heptosyltransferase-2